MDANPYKPPAEESRLVEDVEPRPGETWWRVYLYLHLASVALTGLASWLDSSRPASGLAWLFSFTTAASMSCYCTPLVSIWLAYLVASRGRRYLMLAVTDALLTFVHPLVMLPLVQ